ncbi:unnamed protein product [Arabidopsis thaliana]|uniref:Uncharacterized protein n=1 Tax=Arabidopsis thaliana TaxID=3702 RepID=A0A5S9YEC8_ARATH|nr:unnamed protein product [Arabidopsis thaliana]
MHVDNVSKNLVNNPGNMNEAFGVILRSNRKYSSIYEIKKVLGVLEQKKKKKDDQNAFLDRFVAQVLHPLKTFPCTKLRDFGLYGNVEGSKTAMNWNCGSELILLPIQHLLLLLPDSSVLSVPLTTSATPSLIIHRGRFSTLGSSSSLVGFNLARFNLVRFNLVFLKRALAEAKKLADDIEEDEDDAGALVAATVVFVLEILESGSFGPEQL